MKRLMIVLLGTLIASTQAAATGSQGEQGEQGSAGPFGSSIALRDAHGRAVGQYVAVPVFNPDGFPTAIQDFGLFDLSLDRGPGGLVLALIFGTPVGNGDVGFSFAPFFGFLYLDSACTTTAYVDTPGPVSPGAIRLGVGIDSTTGNLVVATLPPLVLPPNTPVWASIGGSCISLPTPPRLLYGFTELSLGRFPTTFSMP